MIRSTKHTLRFSNFGKLEKLKNFIVEYRRVATEILDQMWNEGYGEFVPSKEKLECPKFLNYNSFKVKTNLSGRVLRTLTTQLAGIVRGSIKKHKAVLYLRDKRKLKGAKLHKMLKKYPLRKPCLNNLKPELNSICCDFQESGKEFDEFFALKSLGADIEEQKFGKICLPITMTSVSNKWGEKGKQLSGVSLTETSVTLRYEIEPEKTKKTTKNKKVGIDQGLLTTATLSDGQKTPNCDCHGHSFVSIIEGMSRKQKGSKAFKRATEHRKNFINWSINQLDFSEISEVRIEKIWNIGYKKRRSRKLSYWTNTVIRDKIKRRCEELEVPVVEQDSSYRSQRCFECGIVRKANRKGKLYKCKHCGYEADSDFNASLNHSINLPDIDWRLRGRKHNLGNGFHWKPEGLFTFDGRELTVPSSTDKIPRLD